MKKFFNKAKVAAASFALMAAGSANAALVQADVDAIKVEVLADLAIAIAAGFAIFGVSIAAKVGFSMLSRFINKGARG